MGALFGSLSALFIGISDLFARRVVKASSALTTAATLQLVAIFISLASVAAFGGTFLFTDLFIGLVSGLGLGVGMTTYYEGMARSSATVVSPMVAVLSAVIPLIYTVINGASTSAFALVGAGISIVGLMLITIGGGAVRHVRTGLWWGAVSGIAYGIGFAIIIECSNDAGAWPAFSQRLAAAALLCTLALRNKLPVIPPVGARVTGLIGGLFIGFTTVFYLIGIRADATAAVVTSSMFPVASVAIGRVFFNDSVSRLQAIGIAVVLVGVTGVVVG
jgi:drug/metabolite transporter (DMT)-like permease